jgi:hypothetical protein
MSISKGSSFDVTIVQQGDTYIVSGKDAGALHAKIATLPPASRNLVVGPLTDGTFTLQKIEDVQQQAG